MTTLSLSPIAGYVWLAAAWIFLAAVLLKRWREREAARAEATEEVMESLTSDTTGLHEQDAC